MLRPKVNSQSQADLNRTIGTVLRERRESLGLSWEEISREIHIQVKYLRAVEAGHTMELPDNIYFRMFAKVYSEQMGLNFSKVIAVVQENPPELANSDQAASALEPESLAEFSTEGSGQSSFAPGASLSPQRNRIKFGGVGLAHSVNWRPIFRYSMIGVGVVLLGFVIRYAAVSKGFARSSGPGETVSEQTAEKSLKQGFDTKNFDLKNIAMPEEPLRLRARATADVDLRVLADSITLYDKELESGEVLNFEAKYRFEISASDLDRIEFFIDNQPLTRIPSENGQISSFELTQFNYKEFLEAQN